MIMNSNPMGTRCEDKGIQATYNNDTTILIEEHFGGDLNMAAKLAFDYSSLVSINIIQVDYLKAGNNYLLNKQNHKTIGQLDITLFHSLSLQPNSRKMSDFTGDKIQNACKSEKFSLFERLYENTTGKRDITQFHPFSLLPNIDKIKHITMEKDVRTDNGDELPFKVSNTIGIKDYFEKNDPDPNRVSERPHKIDFYQSNKPYLNIIQGKFTRAKFDPYFYRGIFLNFSKHPESLIEGKELDTSKENATILKFKDKNDKYYVVKRRFHKIQNFGSKETKEFLEKEIEKNYREFGVMKLFNLCPYSVEAIEIQFLYIENYSYFVTELLTEYGGETLKSLIEKRLIKPEHIFSIFSQLIKALNYLKSYKIQYNDIKPENIVIDFTGSTPKAKLMNFDICTNDSTSITIALPIDLKGYSEEYAAPEIYSKLENKSTCYDPYASQIFCFGVCILYLLNFFSPVELPIHKFFMLTNDNNEENKERLKKKFDQFSKSHSDKPLICKIFEVSKFCISYDPKDRITANNLLYTLDRFSEYNINDLINELESLKIKNQERKIMHKENHDYSIDSISKIQSDKQAIQNLIDQNTMGIKIEKEEKYQNFEYKRSKLLNGNKENENKKPNSIIHYGNEFFSNLISQDGFSFFTGTRLKNEEDWKCIGYMNSRNNSNFYVGEVNKEIQYESFGKLQYENGSTYYGQFSKGRRHGLGIIQIESNNIKETYFGFWKNGYRKGEGYCIYEDLFRMKRETYFGSWKYNMKYGKGILISSDGSRYEGEWNEDQKHGRGMMKYHDGKIFEGSWLNNEKHGYGFKFKQKEIDIYSVRYDNGKEIESQKLNTDN